MATLIDYSNVGLYIISNDPKKFKQVVSSFPEIAKRYKFVANDLLGELYSAEINLKELRIDIGL
jgi:flagellar motor component MotA